MPQSPLDYPFTTLATSRHRTGPVILAALLLGAGLGPSALDAQGTGNGGERRAVTALSLRSGEGIQLDGHITEAAWSRAMPAREFLQREPVEGAAPTESTTVYVVYDNDNLYIGAIMFDSEPEKILAQQNRRDALWESDDRFMWILDTFLDSRTGYFFGTNPNGLMSDALMGAGGFFGINMSWDGIWEVRTARRPDGWSAEIQIPFRTLNFDPSKDTWGINFHRTVRRKNEETSWSGHRRNQSFTRSVHAGLVTGLKGMSQGLGLEAKPYAVAGWRYNPDQADPTVDPTDFPRDVGLDVSYNLTTSLRAALTVNTDFAEVDVDQRRVNLTRFPLRFPERRDFFLEGSGVFGFVPSNGVEPFFSRNIGLNQGSPVPITFGTRLGGQAGRYELGFLQVRTGQEQFSLDGVPTDLQGEDFTVARLKRTLFVQSSIGAIYTRRATSRDDTGFAPPDRHTVGADLDLYTSRFLGDKNLQFQAFFVWNSDPDVGGTSSFWDRTARGVRVSYPNDVWRIHTSYRELDVGHNPALGFTRRNGFRRLQPTIRFAPRPGGFMRQVEFEVEHQRLMDMDWNLETRRTRFKIIGFRFESQDRLDFNVTQIFERLEVEDQFQIRDVTISAGRYNTWEWRLGGSTATRRRISVRGSIRGGGFWSGTRSGYNVNLTVRPKTGMSLGANYDRNNISLPGGEFTTNLMRLEGGWHFSPWASFTGNVQYDDDSELVGLFARFRWIIRPGNDLFLVYTSNWLNEGDRLHDFDFTTLSRGASTKLNYTYRF